MSTFRCGKCGCSEDTALCNYWTARVRDILPVCSACDAGIGKWHGEFPRLFGTFLSTPIPRSDPRDMPASLVDRLAEGGGRPKRGIEAPSGMFDFNDPVPSYKPLTASRSQ